MLFDELHGKPLDSQDVKSISSLPDDIPRNIEFKRVVDDKSIISEASGLFSRSTSGISFDSSSTLSSSKKSSFLANWETKVKGWSKSKKAGRRAMYAGAAMIFIGAIGVSAFSLTANGSQGLQNSIDASGKKIYNWKLKQEACRTAVPAKVAQTCRD